MGRWGYVGCGSYHKQLGEDCIGLPVFPAERLAVSAVEFHVALHHGAPLQSLSGWGLLDQVAEPERSYLGLAYDQPGDLVRGLYILFHDVSPASNTEGHLGR